MAARPALAQIAERTTPPAAYYAAFGYFYDGDYPDALKAFQAEGRSSIKNAQSRWIDSICYETMCGECYFQMGILDKALQHYTAALQLYKTFPDWMMKVQFPPTIRAGRSRGAEGRPLGRQHAAIPVGLLSHVDADRSGADRFQRRRPARRDRAAGQLVSRHPAGDRPCDDVGPAAPGDAAGARLEVRSLDRRRPGGAEPADRPAQPLVRSVDQSRARPGAGGRRKRGPGDRLLAAGRAGGRRVRPSPDQRRPVGVGPAGAAAGRLPRGLEVLRGGHLRGGQLSRLRRAGRGLPLRHVDALAGQPQGILSAVGDGHPMGESEETHASCGPRSCCAPRRTTPCWASRGKRRPCSTRPAPPSAGGRWPPGRSAPA